MHRCKDIVELLTELMEGGLPPQEARRVEDEATRCVPCRDFLASLRRMPEAVRQMECADLPEECHAALRRILDSRLPSGS